MENFISSRKVNDVTVINFCFDEISLVQRENLKKDLYDLLHENDHKFVIDLSKIGFFSSLVIATIVSFAKEARKTGGDLKLSGLTDEALSVFRLTNLDKIFELYETDQIATESFK